MNIVIPMAGRGSRFSDAGWRLPKPLIPVLGRPMYAWSTDSLPLSLARRLVFVCLEEHLRAFSLEHDIRDRYQDYEVDVVALDDVTDGQLCTVLAARDAIDDERSLLIYNADTWCRTSLDQTLPALERRVDGVIGVFEAEGEHWSFARTDDHGRVIETAEKRRISRWATTGLYHFSDSRRFLRQAELAVAEGDKSGGEYYVAPLYNRLIADGADIRIDVAIEVQAMGTPAELEAFEARRAALEGSIPSPSVVDDHDP